MHCFYKVHIYIHTNVLQYCKNKKKSNQYTLGTCISSFIFLQYLMYRYANYYINTKQTILLVCWLLDLVVHFQHKNDDRLFVKTLKGLLCIDRKKFLSAAICHSSLLRNSLYIIDWWVFPVLSRMIDKINDYYIIYT